MKTYTEEDLKRILSGRLTLPKETQDQWARTCRTIRERVGVEHVKIKRRRFPVKRQILVAALAGMMGCAAAAAALATDTDFYEAAFGDKSRSSIEAHEVTDPVKKTTRLAPEKQQIGLDAETAETWLKDVLFDEPVTRQMDGYTLTVLGGVEDLKGQNGRLYFYLSKEGGFKDKLQQNYYWRESVVPGVSFSLMEQSENGTDTADGNIFSGACYLDEEKTDGDTAYLVLTYALPRGYETTPEKTLRMTLSAEDGDPKRLLIDLPSDLASTENRYFKDSETGGGSVLLSPIGLSYAQIAFRYADTEKAGITLEFNDGSQYVVTDETSMNVDYGYESQNGRNILCFNRIVDPDQVAAIHINGRRCVPDDHPMWDQN